MSYVESPSAQLFFLSFYEIKFLSKKVIKVSEGEDIRVHRKYNMICHLKEKKGLAKIRASYPWIPLPYKLPALLLVSFKNPLRVAKII
jgi:hypothetical protein